MKKLLGILLILSLVFGVAFAEAQQEYPARDINDVITWGAGGGTDTCNRIIMQAMGEELGVNINCNNVTGGSGVVGLDNAYEKPADGYTLCGLSESNTTAAVRGWDHTMKVWDFFVVGGSPDILSVTPNCPYQTLEALVEASKANPNDIKVGAAGSGSIHHLNLLAFQEGSGSKLAFIPYEGSAPAQNAAMTGEITVIITSVAEQAELIKAGKLRPLAMMTPDKFAIGDIKIGSSFDSYPALANYLPLGQQIGFAVRKDTDQAIKDKLVAAFKQAMKADAVIEFGAKNYYNLTGTCGEEADEIFKKLESKFSYTLYELNATKINPASLGIEK